MKDNHTGLIWEVKEQNNDVEGESPRDGDDRFTWYSLDPTTNGGWPGPDNITFTNCNGQIPNSDTNICTTSGFVFRVNAQELCGIDSWRMPSVNELNGLVHYGQDRSSSTLSPMIDTDYFPTIDRTQIYWTGNAAIHFNRGNQAWASDFGAGLTLLSPKNRGYLVMLVADSESTSETGETFETRAAKAEAYSIFRNDFMPIAKHEKCMNCHEFVINNDIYQTHISENRISSLNDHDLCANCHTDETGFVDDWRAPLFGANATNFLMRDSSAFVTCNAMNRVRDPLHHLLDDHLILWAVEQIPDFSEEDWIELVNSMVVEGTEEVFSCAQP